MNARDAVLAREAAKKPHRPEKPKRTPRQRVVESENTVAIQADPDAKVFENEPTDG